MLVHWYYSMKYWRNWLHLSITCNAFIACYLLTIYQGVHTTYFTNIQKKYIVSAINVLCRAVSTVTFPIVEGPPPQKVYSLDPSSRKLISHNKQYLVQSILQGSGYPFSVSILRTSQQSPLVLFSQFCAGFFIKEDIPFGTHLYLPSLYYVMVDQKPSTFLESRLPWPLSI